MHTLSFGTTVVIAFPKLSFSSQLTWSNKTHFAIYFKTKSNSRKLFGLRFEHFYRSIRSIAEHPSATEATIAEELDVVFVLEDSSVPIETKMKGIKSS